MRNILLTIGLFYYAIGSNASTQVALNQDKPSFVEVVSSKWSQTGRWLDSPLQATWEYNGNWSVINGGGITNRDGLGGAMGNGYDSGVVIDLSTNDTVTGGYSFWGTNDCGASGNISGTNALTGDDLDDLHMVSQCKGAITSGADVTLGCEWPSNAYLPVLYENDTADCTVILHTGGRAKSQLQNLFGYTASAVQITGPCDYWGLWEGSIPVPPTSITIPGVGPLDTNGVAYGLLPDNADIDITPSTPFPYYSFSVGATKYKSHLGVYVNQPDLVGYSMGGAHLYHSWTLTGNAGHAWWQLSCDAPASVVNLFTSTNNSQWLNQQVGYGPNGSIIWTSPWTIGSAPGKCPYPYNNAPTVVRSYAIGFPNLISGLNYTENLSTTPGIYAIPNNSCVTETRMVGAAAGIGLPDDSTPEYFGWDLPPSSP
jgi:hypothetical protein